MTTVADLFDLEPSSAVLSEDGIYRYSLDRTWQHGGPRALFVMLNPSTADAHLDDPTIRRCKGFALALGCTGVTVVNLYAYRATKPADLWRAEDPVGPENDEHLADTLTSWRDLGWPVIGAWGANAEPERVRDVLRLVDGIEWTALSVTAGGMPGHPLYISGAARPQPYSYGTEDPS